MSTSAQVSTTKQTPGPMRGTALVAGLLYLVTFLTSIPTLTLYQPLRDQALFMTGGGSADTVLVGALLEVGLALSCVGTAVVLFPVVKRQSEAAALGFLTARTLEAALILVGVVSLLSLLTLRDQGGTDGAGSAALVTAGRALLAVHDGTFLLGQSLMPVLSALCLGSVLYRSRLVPRLIPTLGLVGAPLLLASDIAIFCGIYDQRTSLAGVAALPIAAWEITLAVCLVVKGFRPCPILQQPQADTDADLRAPRPESLPQAHRHQPEPGAPALAPPAAGLAGRAAGEQHGDARALHPST